VDQRRDDMEARVSAGTSGGNPGASGVGAAGSLGGADPLQASRRTLLLPCVDRGGRGGSAHLATRQVRDTMQQCPRHPDGGADDPEREERVERHALLAAAPQEFLLNTR
jgi:hypothetical protein